MEQGQKAEHSQSPKADEKAKNEAQADEKKLKADEKTKIIKQLKSEGFHNCTRVRLVKGENNNIAKFGEVVNKIKAMHESNIDNYNSQQVNTLQFLKKDGVKYELVEVKVPGRQFPLKMFMEIKK